MKKKEKPKAKEKEFAVAPFQGLKRLALDAPKASTPAPAPPKKAQREANEDDDLLFLDAFADVKRLNTPVAPAKGKAPVPKQPKKQDDEEARVFLQAVESLRMDVRFREEPAEELPTPLPVNRLRQLRRGAIRVDLELDLHGLTKEEALENLARFVRGAYGRGQKGVLVITGKGNNSPGEPVLKQAVATWLREHGKAMVSEFIAAPRDMGGSGAFVIFLKEKKEAPWPEK